jgi:hypothetical protein
MPIARTVMAAGLAAILALASITPAVAQNRPASAPQMSVDVITQGAATPANHGYVVPGILLALTIAVLANASGPTFPGCRAPAPMC